MTDKPLTYLACPYSHPDRNVRVARFDAANRCAAYLMQAGRKVYSPISHTHSIAEVGELPLGWDFWQEYERAFLSYSKEVFVLMLDGWLESKGIDAELQIAREMDLPIYYMDSKFRIEL